MSKVNSPVQAAPATKGGKSELLTFKAKLGWRKRVWRSIEIPDHLTLEDLSNAIHRAFGLSVDEHLHAFYLSGKTLDRKSEYIDPRVEDDLVPRTSDTTLKSLRLQPRQKFLFLYDFGDSLKFEVELITVIDQDPTDKNSYPRIVKTNGEWVYDEDPEYEDDEED